MKTSGCWVKLSRRLFDEENDKTVHGGASIFKPIDIKANNYHS